LHRAQFVVNANETEVPLFIENLKHVFGISWYTAAAVCESKFDVICEVATKLGIESIQEGDTFGVKAKRSHKILPFGSIDLQQTVGAAIGKATLARVNLSSPDVQVNIAASKEGTYIFTKRYEGSKGLPVGTSGKVLSLLSGGFDSIAASYLLAKRGAQVDYLHFHIFMDKSNVLNTKIGDIVRGLDVPTKAKKLFVSSYGPFEMKVLNLDKISQRYETVIFRRLMARVGEGLAKKFGYQVLLFGDSLGQVASQTMENMIAVDDAVDIPVFRPLVAYDKYEVVDLVRKIGLFDEAVAEYKDCCSILSPNPIKKADLDTVRKIEAHIGLDQIVEEMLEAIEEVDIRSMTEPTEIN
jgi:thiamine biosynthesis protein ThiI